MNHEESSQNRLSYIFGRPLKGQARLIRLARQESARWRTIRLEEHHYRYLADFCKRHLSLIVGLLILLLSQGVIESVLVVFSRNQLSGDVRLWLSDHFWSIFVSLCFVFLANAFFAVKYERSLLVILANSLRRRIFKAHISRVPEAAQDMRQAELVAKISYHLPLVSLGVSNAFFGTWRWLVYAAIVSTLAVAGGFRILYILPGFVILSVALGLVAYFIARRYVSQEVTFYSRIMKEVDFNASDSAFLKAFGQEKAVLAKFDRLVWFDSFFRVRRDLIMRLALKAVFVLLAFLSVWTHFFSRGFFAFIGSTSAAGRLLLLFFVIYFSRALIEAVKIGLYLFPARLGLYLSIIRPSRTLVQEEKHFLQNTSVCFQAGKIQLFPEGPYYRRLQFTVQPGDRVLITGESLSGKTSFAKLIAGMEAYNPRALKIRLADERLEYSEWQRKRRGAYYIDPNFRSDRSLMECLCGQVKEEIAVDGLPDILNTLNQYPALITLVAADGNYNRSAAEVLANPVRAFALHALHCLVSRCDLIVIDNAWLDMGYEEIAVGLRSLAEGLPRAIIVVAARRDNTILSYTARYALGASFEVIT